MADRPPQPDTGRPHTYWYGTPCSCSWGADHGNGTADGPSFAQPAEETPQPAPDLSDEELAELERWAHGAFPTTALYRNMLACIAMARRTREAEAAYREAWALIAEIGKTRRRTGRTP